ncbi:unnamed protein product (macronuclear) [Paramecium tetraurelia]|uniref:SUEL-type lectin domain-containing protein n=1 Tax=Paramecium tetraurelia TaxID=5888 RepID=A0CAZ4_PARTE|nr:uncharacterized protein GSPATT00036744001 [Paramecium tetraurelia]CAK67961.1 unnamed protein product [Paramecium tetraurelia]|eukprot:XP_001435358.1 hypothetical protein (macronuclear) [Paramecium tetraurelia strain d4-2]
MLWKNNLFCGTIMYEICNLSLRLIIGSCYGYQLLSISPNSDCSTYSNSATVKFTEAATSTNCLGIATLEGQCQIKASGDPFGWNGAQNTVKQCVSAPADYVDEKYVESISVKEYSFWKRCVDIPATFDTIIWKQCNLSKMQIHANGQEQPTNFLRIMLLIQPFFFFLLDNQDKVCLCIFNSVIIQMIPIAQNVIASLDNFINTKLYNKDLYQCPCNFSNAVYANYLTNYTIKRKVDVWLNAHIQILLLIQLAKQPQMAKQYEWHHQHNFNEHCGI